MTTSIHDDIHACIDDDEVVQKPFDNTKTCLSFVRSRQPTLVLVFAFRHVSTAFRQRENTQGEYRDTPHIVNFAVGPSDFCENPATLVRSLTNNLDNVQVIQPKMREPIKRKSLSRPSAKSRSGLVVALWNICSLSTKTSVFIGEASETPKFPIFRKNPEMRLKHQNSPEYAIFSETLGTQSISTKPQKTRNPGKSRRIAENRGESRAGLRR